MSVIPLTTRSDVLAPEARARGLEEADFVHLAAAGFGDPQNSYAFSMEWYEGALYVGTVRNMLAMVAAAPPPEPARLEPWPVHVPDDLYECDQRAQLWRYDPAEGMWDNVYTSPVIEGKGGPVPRDIGYRAMVRFSGTDEPALFVAGSASASRGRGAHVLRYDSGRGVTAVMQPRLAGSKVTALRSLVVFEELLCTSAVGQGRAWNSADRPCVYGTGDPTRGEWLPLAEPHFGDPTNTAIYTLATFRDRLYAGTLNPKAGFQLWRTEAGRVGGWRKVIDEGAGRGVLNQGVVSMCSFKDALYLGTGISNGGYDRTYKIGPAAGEVIRVYPDDSWDLVVGNPRMAGRRMVRPTSGLDPGFGNPFAGYIWSMAVHDGWLYIGTLDSLVLAQWRDSRYMSGEDEVRVTRELARTRGGAELWRTRDGLNFSAVTLGGFGNPYNYGIRTLRSTPAGLAVGTANPFGPYVAVERSAGWEYVRNPLGGAEVLLGAREDPR